MNLVPTVIEQSSRGERAYDLLTASEGPYYYALWSN